MRALICILRPPTVVALIAPAPCGLPGVDRFTGSLKLTSGASKFGWLNTLDASALSCRPTFSKRLKVFPIERFAVSMPGARSEFRLELPNVPLLAVTKAVGSYHCERLCFPFCAGCRTLGYHAPACE